MKKFTTSLFALAVVVSAVALPLQKTAPEAAPFEPLKAVDFTTVKQMPKYNFAPLQLEKKGYMGMIKSNSISTKALPDGVTPTIYYSDPSGAFYPMNSFSLNGAEGYVLPAILVPAYATLDWINYSYYMATDATTGRETPTLVGSDATWSWSYADFYGSEATAETEDLTTSNQPMPLKGFPEVAPVLTANGDANLQYETNFPIYGGNGAYGEAFLTANSSTGYVVSDLVYTGVKSYDVFSDNFYGHLYTGSFGSGANDFGDGTNANPGSGWDAWATYYGFTDYSVDGMVQIFNKPASPYALNDLTVLAFVDCAAGAELNFTFFKLNDEGQVTSEVVKEYTYTFAEAYNSNSTGMYYPITVPFTSTDALGFELDYQLIDCGMAMMITGFYDSAFTTFDLPVAFYLDGTTSTIVGGTSFYAYTTFNYNGQAMANLFQFPYSFYTDKTYTTTISPVSMNITMNLEYPYLQVYGNYTTGEGYEPKAEYTVGAYAGGSVEIGMLCSAYASDIIYETADGSDIPSWLTVEISDNTFDYSGLTGEDVIVKFSVDANVEDVNHTCDIVLSYKGQTQTFHVNHYSSSVENIGNDAVETVESEYYNLQGQKLVAAPQNGVFIQKNIKDDGSVQNVKVVK